MNTPIDKFTIVKRWVERWKDKDIALTVDLLDENVEMRSTLIMSMFPDSGGVIKREGGN